MFFSLVVHIIFGAVENVLDTNITIFNLT